MDEQGAHGCYLVEVGSNRKTQVHAIDVDAFRYRDETIDADDMAIGRDLRQLMTKLINRLQAEANGRHVLVRWHIQMDLENASVVGPAALEELIVWLRREFGYGAPATWSNRYRRQCTEGISQKVAGGRHDTWLLPAYRNRTPQGDWETDQPHEFRGERVTRRIRVAIHVGTSRSWSPR